MTFVTPKPGSPSLPIDPIHEYTLNESGVAARRSPPRAHRSVVETIRLTAETTPLYEALGVPRGGCYLVRPDLYIAYRSAAWNAERFAHNLERFLIKTEQRQQSSLERVGRGS
jgi:hypothetical protein